MLQAAQGVGCGSSCVLHEVAEQLSVWVVAGGQLGLKEGVRALDCSVTWYAVASWSATSRE